MSNQYLKLQAEAKIYEKLEAEITNKQNTKQQRYTQKNENELVLSELQLLGDDAIVYKLVGPALIKQEKYDALSVVKNRLDFIAKDITDLDADIKETVAKQQEQKALVIKLQQQMQAASVPKK